MSEEPKPRRRQARGERRIAQLLQAAANVFCANGYTATSTNAIAREAHVSPGTLYQYFPNKEAIAIELGGRLLHDMRAAHGQAFTPENLALPLPEMLDAVVDPLIEFNCANPAFLALMHGSEIPGRIAEEHDELHRTLLARVQEVIGHYAPTLSAAERSRIAGMTFAAFKGGLDLVLAAPEGPERDATVAELKALLLRYLAPLTERPVEGPAKRSADAADPGATRSRTGGIHTP
ncbi:TetR/AcrR family transcriptional regulator [Streptomyces sp. WAC00288]|uniref:TetR/AcrR family transcriptional regulator n=1 Tax=unclassified Streptomyces TaxID=2593676 RepID=UPI00099FE579|nr:MULTISPECIES: TetR/AcrR family transcriptional regulator [unclassified Streptomyces]AVH97435.1 TetR/AcrR family transcriptional regulator [Streptomyces sp. WAC00288]